MESIRLDKLEGTRVTVMGLGQNGGGVASARFLAERGALVTVTDTKDESTLAASVSALSDLDIRFVLGRHEESDFRDADFVVKNPAVRPDNEYLRLATAVETDLSMFLRLCPAPIAAITGSKGKSTTSTALAWILNNSGKKAFLGGNITVSPLGFLSELTPDDVVVLELSSWQLGDLKGKGVLKPFVSVLTRIVPDHLDRYGTMDAYVADKRLIYADQNEADWTVYDADDPYGLSFASETKARVLGYGSSLAAGTYGCVVPEGTSACTGFLPDSAPITLVPETVLIPGYHNRRNLAAAALAAWACGAPPAAIAEAASSFPGIEHRLELVRSRRGVRWYNDSAATVPEAVAAAVSSFNERVVLITGGTDKQLDFDAARSAYRAAGAIILLAGSGTDKILRVLEDEGLAYEGPFDQITLAVAAADAASTSGSVVILSPGCTSFGMFRNEFDRGRSYKAVVVDLEP
ncbi:MAG: UDP-N-acetylmuramoyl-L-alanine--D-glutamate ligase [Spirochaetales bacterium]|nr:UDP-N-acetylmuramoyl-L-alanine--D-glutamate ligase [Spirochaetales bacterium]